jgi:hypothetical protein
LHGHGATQATEDGCGEVVPWRDGGSGSRLGGDLRLLIVEASQAASPETVGGLVLDRHLDAAYGRVGPLGSQVGLGFGNRLCRDLIFIHFRDATLRSGVGALASCRCLTGTRRQCNLRSEFSP